MGHVGLISTEFIGGGDVGFRAYSYNYNPSITGTCNVSYNPVVSHVPPKSLIRLSLGYRCQLTPKLKPKPKTLYLKPDTPNPIPRPTAMRNSAKALVYLGLRVQDSGPRIRVQGSGDLGFAV